MLQISEFFTELYATVDIYVINNLDSSMDLHKICFKIEYQISSIDSKQWTELSNY